MNLDLNNLKEILMSLFILICFKFKVDCLVKVFYIGGEIKVGCKKGDVSKK